MKKILAALSLLALATTAFAYPTKPAKCPDAGSLANGGLNPSIIAQDADGLWTVGMNRSKYDTTDSWWTFVVGRISARDRTDAYARAVGALKGMTFQQGPFAMTKINKWGCTYNNIPGYVAIAVTPSLEGASSDMISIIHAA